MRLTRKPQKRAFWIYADKEDNEGWMVVGFPTKKAINRLRNDDYREGHEVSVLMQIEIPMSQTYKKAKREIHK